MESDELLSEGIALKGGTAINLTVFDLPRLSVDIDLDYCRSIDREEMIEINYMLRCHVLPVARREVRIFLIRVIIIMLPG